jgi:hypothetical protein
MSQRFQDVGQTIYGFTDLFLVHCPQCAGCARVVPLDASKTWWSAPRRLVCARCGYTKDHDGRSAVIGADTDWYFGLPLWLQTPCCGETLWAYNTEHLDFLEQYVAATLRERTRRDGTPLREPRTARNGSIASRLPAWIKSAKNREAVLKGIGKLRQMLE